ncbi:MAG: outer membrane beta-barrel protein [Pseudomonadota bacterium]
MAKYSFYVVAIPVLGFASPAIAQDEDTQFTGFRVEALIGYDSTEAGSSAPDDNLPTGEESVDGVFFGIAAGYDYDFGKIVLGAEAEASFTSADSEFPTGSFEGLGAGELSSEGEIYFGVRAGAKVTKNALLYIKGGIVNSRIDLESTVDGTAIDDDVDLNGFRLGAGGEMMFTANWFAKVEYRYSNYEEGEVDFGGDVPDSPRFDIDTDRHQILVGVGYRF